MKATAGIAIVLLLVSFAVNLWQVKLYQIEMERIPEIQKVISITDNFGNAYSFSKGMYIYIVMRNKYHDLFIWRNNDWEEVPCKNDEITECR